MATLLQTVIDTTDVRRAAAFYQAWLGWTPREEADPDEELDWLVLRGREPGERLALQLVDELTPSTWPEEGVAQQLHLDFLARDREALEADRARIESLGGRLLLNRSDDEEEPLYVFADLDGHPFCVFCWTGR